MTAILTFMIIASIVMTLKEKEVLYVAGILMFCFCFPIPALIIVVVAVLAAHAK